MKHNIFYVLGILLLSTHTSVLLAQNYTDVFSVSDANSPNDKATRYQSFQVIYGKQFSKSAFVFTQLKGFHYGQINNDPLNGIHDNLYSGVLEVGILKDLAFYENLQILFLPGLAYKANKETRFHQSYKGFILHKTKFGLQYGFGGFITIMNHKFTYTPLAQAHYSWRKKNQISILLPNYIYYERCLRDKKNYAGIQFYLDMNAFPIENRKQHLLFSEYSISGYFQHIIQKQFVLEFRLEQRFLDFQSQDYTRKSASKNSLTSFNHTYFQLGFKYRIYHE